MIALIVALCVSETGRVEIENAARSDPAPATRVCGTTAEVSVEFSVTVNPFNGAGPVSTTVPPTLVPPVTDVGLSWTALTTGAATVSTADGLERGGASRTVAELTTAEIVTDRSNETATVVNGWATEVWPAVGCMLGGTDTGMLTDCTEPSLRRPD